jgi:hypothetical protein
MSNSDDTQTYAYQADGYKSLQDRVVAFRDKMLQRFLDRSVSLIEKDLFHLSNRLWMITSNKYCPVSIFDDCQPLFGLRGEALKSQLIATLDKYRNILASEYSARNEPIEKENWVSSWLPSVGWNGDITPLENAIVEYKMESTWGDSFEPLTEEQSKAKISTRRNEAINTFSKIMRSKNNDGGFKYQDWAVKKTLGLRTHRGYTAQAIGGKHWQSWGRKPSEN